MKTKKVKVAVAVSGGVDSSAVAFLLKKEGYDVIGLHMILENESKEAENAARRVCQQLQIPFYPINLKPEFEKCVVSYFKKEYESGLTPNPCIRCNQTIKFGALLAKAREIGALYLATGHYVIKKSKIKNQKLNIHNYELHKAKDASKDQSYFLYHLTQAQLKHILFPLGDYLKSDIKKIAEKAKLPNIKSESQDICFLSDYVDHNEYLKKHIKLKPGEIKTLDGKTVGQHKGLPLYTIGQRRGIEIGGIGPFYAVRMDYKNNILWVSADRDDKELYSKSLEIQDANWINPIKFPLKCLAVVRYHHPPVECAVKKTEAGIKVEFKEPVRAIAVGQSIVFYDLKDIKVLGGGIII